MYTYYLILINGKFHFVYVNETSEKITNPDTWRRICDCYRPQLIERIDNPVTSFLRFCKN